MKPRGGYGYVPKYCGKVCYAASLRKVVDRPPCRQCGERPASKRGAFCSRLCAGRSYIRRVQVICRHCGETFEAIPDKVKCGWAKYCSRACRLAATAARVEKTCIGCGVAFQAYRSEAGRKYCSRACRFGHSGGMRVIACAVCGATRRVSSAQLRRGHGKYCSRACFSVANTSPVAERRCERCQKMMKLRPSELDTRFCSRRCGWLSLRRARTFRCRVCGGEEKVRFWQRPKYCSTACSNRGRQRKQPPEEERRNRRVVELHASGLKAPRIAALVWEELGLPIAPATVRTIVFREKTR